MEGAWFQSLEGDEEVSVLNLLNLSKPRQNRLYNGTLHDSDPRHSEAFVSPLPTLQIFADSKAATASRSRRAFPVRNQQTPAQRITKDHKGLKPPKKKQKKPPKVESAWT